MIINDATTYIPAINGTIFSVMLAIRLIPPIITIPTSIAKIEPMITPVEPPVKLNSVAICIVAWLLWKAFPPPNDAPTHRIANNTPNTFPKPGIPVDARPFRK